MLRGIQLWARVQEAHCSFVGVIVVVNVCGFVKSTEEFEGTKVSIGELDFEDLTLEKRMSAFGEYLLLECVSTYLSIG